MYLGPFLVSLGLSNIKKNISGRKIFILSALNLQFLHPINSPKEYQKVKIVAGGSQRVSEGSERAAEGSELLKGS